MIRFFFLLLMVLLSVLALVLCYWLAKRIYRWSVGLVDSSKDYVTKQKQEWEWRQNRKQFPEFMQRGIARLEKARKMRKGLPEEWGVLLNPVFQEADRIVNATIKSTDKGSGVRNFFTVTLDAFELFVRALLEGHSVMKAEEREKALQSIDVFRADFAGYLAQVNEKRRFDFHVLTEVIRQRLSR